MATSIYERGKPASYFWREEQNGDHFQSTAEKIIDCLGSNYHIPPALTGRIKSKVKQRLKVACKGNLRSPTEVRPIHRQPGGSIFEIKWDHLPVSHTPSLASGIYENIEVRVRLYYYQQPDAQAVAGEKPWGVGLRVHEKKILATTEETNFEQNREIDNPVAYHEAHQGLRWHVAELQMQDAISKESLDAEHEKSQ